MKEYWQNIKTSVKTLKKGLEVTSQHLKDARKQRDPLGPASDNYFEKENALFTVQYPKEKLPVPDHGRYKLHNEIEDCIVCDKCAKVCPVNCIDIEPVRATESFGETSDGTPKRIYAAKFDIDMAKCCFCGLCTTVCPTECLTMTDDYDFSAFDFAEHNFEFGNMTPLEILEKKEALEKFQKEKEAAKAQASNSRASAKPKMTPRPSGAKPNIKPQIKPKTGTGSQSKPKVVVKPKTESQKTKPVIKPKPVIKSKDATKPVIKPKVKPVIPPKKDDSDSNE